MELVRTGLAALLVGAWPGTAIAERNGVYVSSVRELRADWSMVYTCKTFGSMQTRREGARDVGVRSIKNDAVCSVHASFDKKAENCVTIHRQGTILAAVRAPGARTACIPGTITLQ